MCGVDLMSALVLGISFPSYIGGMTMGTASNGMVSMQVLCDKYGMSLPAYFAVPVAGLFMDFINAALIAANIAILA